MDEKSSTCFYCIRPPVCAFNCRGTKVCAKHLRFVNNNKAFYKQNGHQNNLVLKLSSFEKFFKRAVKLDMPEAEFVEKGNYIASPYKETNILGLLNHKNQIFVEAHTSEILQIVYCPGKNIIVTVDLKNNLRVWDYSTKLQLYQRFGQVDGIPSRFCNGNALIAVPKNSNFIVTICQDYQLLIWYYRENKCVYLPTKSIKVNSLFLSRNDEILIFTTINEIILVQMQSYEQIMKIDGHEANFISDVSENGKIVGVNKTLDHDIYVYDSFTGEKELTLKQNNKFPLITKFNYSGDLLGVAYKNNTIELWDLKKQVIKCELKGHSERIQFIIFDFKSSQLISGGLDNYVLFWNLETDLIEKRIETSNLGISSAALMEDRNYLAIGYHDKTLRFINLSNTEDVTIASGHSDYVLSLAISNTYTKLASGSHDKMIIIWNIESKAYSNIFNAHDSCVTCLTFSNNEEFLVSGGLDMVVKVWNCKSLKMIWRFDQHDLRIEQVFVSADDMIIVSASGDYKFRLWEIGEECKGFAYFDELDEKIEGFSKSKKYLIVSSKLNLKVLKFISCNKAKQLT